MRSKVVVFSLMSLLFMMKVRAQSDELLVQGQTGNLHLQHTVVAKENWYSIGRLFNLTPQEVAAYNKLTIAKPLSIGQQLQIPLTAGNFSQNGVRSAGESLVPVYHIVQEKEWMYRVSVNHNKVPIPLLEKWNNINKDQVHAGMHLVIGHLKVKTSLSALAARTGAPVASAATITEKPVKAAETPVTGAVKPVTGADKPATDKSVAVAQRPVTGGNKPATSAEMDVDKGVAGTTTEKPATTTDRPVTGGEKAATGSGVKSPPVVTTVTPVSPTGKSFNGGVFKNDFNDGGKSIDGVAGTFKSSSGWQDGKYYALMNNVPVGTIVHVTVSGSGKSIYAKVLGSLPDMKESVGLTIRISNAAASELGEPGEGKFGVTIKY